MSAVSAKYSRASAVRTVIGSLSGNRTELRESFTHAPLRRGYTPGQEWAKDYFGLFAKPKVMRPRRVQTPAKNPARIFLKTCDFSEVEVAHLHGRRDHVKRFFAACPRSFAHGIHFAQHFDQALVETKVAHAALDFSVFDQECAVPRHAGENLFIGVDLADVPQSRHKNPALS